MKHSDKYPPGTEEDARCLAPPCKVCGLHPLWWGMIAVFMIAGVGLYAETVGFYEHIEHLADDNADDHEQDDNKPDDHKTDDHKTDDHKTDDSKD